MTELSVESWKRAGAITIIAYSASYLQEPVRRTDMALIWVYCFSLAYIFFFGGLRYCTPAFPRNKKKKKKCFFSPI